MPPAVQSQSQPSPPAQESLVGSLNLQGESRPSGLGLSETSGGSTCDTQLSRATLAAFGSVILKSHPEGLPSLCR